ncbi:MAG TPA: helix-turn-helix domain-containing protein [Burkholderiaceae bacterium]|jgi:CRP/FNR family transcriptional regulator, anaerobic regulatory protein|nr:helix-turn-helix domain-containing protein [Burkholderiaceae bacterium]
MPSPRSQNLSHVIACVDCGLRELCLVEGMTAAEIDRLSDMVSTRRRVRRGEPLFRAGDRFDAVYPIRLGFFKTRVTTADGREHVTGFPMAGDVLGLDAIGSGTFQGDALALEDAEVCVVPFDRLESLTREFAPLQQQLHRVMSREIVRDRGMMLLLGTLRAEQRVASFLLNLSRRSAQRGFSGREFVLRMTREEIGSFLGLKLETVSRALSKLQEDATIRVAQRKLTILDEPRLREAAGASCSAI